MDAWKDPEPVEVSVATGGMPETDHLLDEEYRIKHGLPPLPIPPAPRLLREGKLPEPPPSQIIKEGQDPVTLYDHIFPPEQAEELQRRINKEPKDLIFNTDWIKTAKFYNNTIKNKKEMRLLLTKAFVEKIETISITLTQAINLNVALEDSAKDPDFHRAVPKDEAKKLVKLNKQLKRSVKRLKTQGRFK